MRIPTKAIKSTFPAHTWQENHSFQEIQIPPWETTVPGGPPGALHIWVPGWQSKEDPWSTKVFYMLKSFCLQWCLGSRMPPEPKQKWSRWRAALWVTSGRGRGCAILLRLERVTRTQQCSHGDTHNFCCHPALPQHYHKVSRWAKCYLLSKQNIVPPLGREGIAFRHFLQCKSRSKKQNKKGRKWLST